MPQDPLQNLAKVIDTAVAAHGVEAVMVLVNNNTTLKFYDYYEPYVKQNLAGPKKVQPRRKKREV